MNKLDKQFEQLMKEIHIDSPSKDFSLKVMERIQAEAAVQKHAILEEYQPVISRKVWVILIVGFISLVIYILYSGQETPQGSNTNIWSSLPDALQMMNTKGISNLWQSVNGLISSIPSVTYLIILASMALWTLDLFLTRIRHSNSDIQIG